MLYQNKKCYNTLKVPFEKSKKSFYFAFIVKKNICVSLFRSGFPVKLIYRIAFTSATSFYCLLKSIAINLLCSSKQGRSSKHPDV